MKQRRPYADVLIFCQRLSVSGGVPIFTRTLASVLAAQGAAISTCSIRERLDEDRLDDLPSGTVHTDLGMPFGRPAGILDHVRIVVRLSRCIVRQQPAVIHANDSLIPYVFAAMRIARLARAPRARLVAQAHEPFASGMMGRQRQRLVRAICRRRSVEVVADVPSIARQLEADLGLPTNSVLALPLGIDVGAFDRGHARGAIRDRHGIPPGATVVCYIARPAPVKNHQLFFDVAHCVVNRHADVWFVTNAPATGTPSKRILGLESLARPQDLLFDADVYLSTSNYEGFGLSIVEAMAAGLAVVATAAGSVPEVVGDTALLAPVGAQEALVEAINGLLEDPTARGELARRGQERAQQRYGLEAFSDRYARLLMPGGPRGS